VTIQRKLLIASIVLVPLLAIVYMHFGYTWSSSAEKKLAIRDTELAAAYGRDSKTVGAVAAGERVEVLYDTYGKDYWACYVRSPTGVRGWVLCTDLKL
jgi:hypothetical protein